MMKSKNHDGECISSKLLTISASNPLFLTTRIGSSDLKTFATDRPGEA